MSEKPLLCVHCVDQYLLNNINGKRINKDQCLKCYDDPVSLSFKNIHKKLIIKLEMFKWYRSLSKMFEWIL